jgi:hypothetical protein
MRVYRAGGKWITCKEEGNTLFVSYAKNKQKAIDGLGKTNGQWETETKIARYITSTIMPVEVAQEICDWLEK